MSKLTVASFTHYANQVTQISSRAAENTLHAMAEAGMPPSGIMPLKKVEEYCGQIQTQLNRMLAVAAGKDVAR